ncbi:HNH endonuclease signature motif containing protein [Acinetobacter indicus]|uniref:HNH endonuclease signature motif containing protein n=1 Tax=Acinetobacter indicus TaxID=756892 RepID=UPI001444539D|nr:HNH endonuclease signature motif containing protein [Acinetobacter indicus]
MGRPNQYSAEELAFVEANHKRPRTEMYAEFVEKFGRTDVTLYAMNSLCKRNRWLTGRKSKGGSHYAPEVIRFISDNRDMPRKELVIAVNEKFGLNMTYTAVTNMCVRRGFTSKRTGRFGEHEGWRKGMAFVEKPIGYETRPDKRGRVYVKVGMPSDYRLKHHVIYENHFGAIPDQHVIKFKDGDDTNFDPSNLIAVHRGATGILTRRYRHHEAPAELKPVLLTMAQIDHKIYQKENRNDS